MSDLAALLPFLMPAIGGLGVLLIVAIERGRAVRLSAGLALVMLAFSAVVTWVPLSRGDSRTLFDGALLIDTQALAFQMVFLLVAALTVMMSIRHLEAIGAPRGEYFALVLFAVSGMTMMAGSENLLTIFMGLEILSVCLYVLAGFDRDREISVEAALKYFLLGAFATGFVLYGIALFYGVTGRIDLRGIASHLQASAGGPPDPLIVVGAALLLIGLAFKIAAVPFHFWAPDVYQGSMAPVAGFMAAGTKAAAFAALLRILHVGLNGPGVREEWSSVLEVLAIMTMILGNLVALAQQNIKRMLAYSSIANAGYLLVAVVAGARTGQAASIVLFYLTAYALMTVGAFAVAALVGRAAEDGEGYQLAAFAGLAKRRPALAAAMAVFMLSLTGIPPTAGFMGKFYIFRGAVDADLYGLAATGLLASVIGAFYYLRVIVQMYLREPGGHPAPAPLTALEWVAITAAAAGTLWVGLFPSQLLSLAQRLL